MNQREELIEKYAKDLREKLDVEPDMALLKKIAIGCGPSIYNADSATVSSSDESELKRVKESFLVKKLGLEDSPQLNEDVARVINRYGKSNRKKYRVVVYYLLTTHYNKETIY